MQPRDPLRAPSALLPHPPGRALQAGHPEPHGGQSPGGTIGAQDWMAMEAVLLSLQPPCSPAGKREPSRVPTGGSGLLARGSPCPPPPALSTGATPLQQLPAPAAVRVRPAGTGARPVLQPGQAGGAGPRGPPGPAAGPHPVLAGRGPHLLALPPTALTAQDSPPPRQHQRAALRAQSPRVAGGPNPEPWRLRSPL